MTKKGIHKWPLRPIGELLTSVRRPVRVEEETTYREIGIRSHCRGIFHKPVTTGKKLGNKRVFWVEPGCLVFNIIFAWEQAVALTSEAEVGMIASHRFPMYHSKNGALLPAYAWRYFSSARGKYDLNIASPGGAGRNKTLGQEEFKRLKIPVPPVEYQRMAVEVLATMDRTIEETERLITAKQKLKNGLAKELLTGNRRLPGFTKPWQRVPLGKTGRCVSGGTPDTDHSDYWSGLHLWCTPTDVTKCAKYICATDRTLTDSGLKAAGVTLLPPGSLLVCTRATIGECVISAAPIATNQGCKSLVFDEGYNPEFMYYSLVEHRQDLRRLANGSTFLEVSKRDFCRVELLVPDVDEQERIAAVLAVVDREIDLLNDQRDALEAQKKGLMQKLLTGQIRVPIKEGAHA